MFSNRQLLSDIFALAIIVLAVVILHRFLLSLVWAGTIAIATWPFFQRLLRQFQGRRIVASAVATLVVCCGIGVPLVTLLVLLVEELHRATLFLLKVNMVGWPAPAWIAKLPFATDSIIKNWNAVLAQPHGLSEFLHDFAATRLSLLSGFLKGVGLQMLHRTVDVIFAMLVLFFLYRDGQRLATQITCAGHKWMPDRWDDYAARAVGAVRATVNGVAFVGIGVGILIGIGYWMTGIEGPILLATLTAILAMIPFGAPVVFGIVAAVLYAQGNVAAALGLLVWGTVVVFIADHFVRPFLISGVTRLPFLAVLFGLLGGIETMGLIGLFIGPVIMVLVLALWREATSAPPVAPPAAASQSMAQLSDS